MRLCQCSMLALLAVVALTTPVLAVTHNVEIFLTSFSPANLIVSAGDTVVWRNNSFLQHTVTSGNSCSPNGIFNSPGVLDPDATFSYTFATVGSFPYFCVPHCLAGMRGTVTVDSPVPVRSTTWGAIKALYAVSTR